MSAFGRSDSGAFVAQYDGTCMDCGARFKAGDQIVRVSVMRMFRYRHETCPDDPRVDLRPGEEVCETCWLVKPCGCEETRR